jgi:hypothetical protein
MRRVMNSNQGVDTIHIKGIFMKKWVLMTLLLTSFGFVSHSQAKGMAEGGMLLDFNLYYVKASNQDAGGPESTSTTMIYDVKLGKFLSKGWYVGGIYSSMSYETSGGGPVSGTAYGLSGGYAWQSGFFVMAHYKLNATYGTYSDGSGLQFDLGYKDKMGSNALWGLELSQRSITYKKNGGAAVEYKTTDLIPMASIGYMF